MIPEIKVGDVYRVNRDDFIMIYLVTRVNIDVYFTVVYTKSDEVFTGLRVPCSVFSKWTRETAFVKL